ncbi:MAG: hypothetical protein OIF35_07725, partial [Cellvibrionaceae bacterium]|nr:hypothetical protein [Cellvibrionaceae bacterium]
QGLWLLDWEYGDLGNPLIDLAGVLISHPWADAELEQFLRAYNPAINKAWVYRAAMPVALMAVFWHALHGSSSELLAEAKASLNHYWRLVA